MKKENILNEKQLAQILGGGGVITGAGGSGTHQVEPPDFGG